MGASLSIHFACPRLDQRYGPHVRKEGDNENGKCSVKATRVVWNAQNTRGDHKIFHLDEGVEW